MASKKSSTTKKTNQKSDLLYIMSNSCGWCKKSQPVVDELVSEGAKITTLDVQNPDDQARINEVKQKYNAQCGTPFFIDAETGNSVCGFREKDVIQKWVNGEEIPKPPQPKSPPPPPPSPETIDDAAVIKDWTTKYEAWAEENKHLPKIMPADQVLDRVKKSYEMRAQQGQQPGQPGQPAPQAAQPTTGGDTGNVVVDNRLQILESKQNILEAKLDQILAAVTNKNSVIPPKGNQPAKPTQPAQPKKVEVDAKVKEQVKQMKSQKDATTAKSKSNKKTVKNF